jgi:CBS domain-containing protein
MHRLSVADLMTTDVVSVSPGTGYREIADLLVRRRISAVPVVSAEGRVLGVVSQADLLQRIEYADARPHHPLVARTMSSPRSAGGTTADSLMSSPAVTIDAAAPVSKAARLMMAARVKRLPVVDSDGRLVGVLSRHDVLQLLARPDDEIRRAVEHTLRALGLGPPQLRVEVTGGQVRLSGVADDDTARTAAAVLAALPGVVDVVDATSRPAVVS